MARPRSVQAHRKVLEAASVLFAERGIDATSMDAIAEASGVSKATIYKHWPDKDQLCLEMLSYLYGLNEEVPVFDSGDLRTDLIAQLKYEPAKEKHEIRERIYPHVIAYATRHRIFSEQWRARVMERPRTRLKQMMRNGIERKTLVTNMNLDVGLALLLGPMLYRRIFNSQVGNKLRKDFEQQVVDAFLAAYTREDTQKMKKKIKTKHSRQE